LTTTPGRFVSIVTRAKACVTVSTETRQRSIVPRQLSGPDSSSVPSGLPRRPIGITARSFAVSPLPALLGTWIVPGATALTRMPSGPHSRAIVRASASSAAFDAA